jgi:trans-2,3-dihydro-3-hydroxyanthranilate isomerase
MSLETGAGPLAIELLFSEGRLSFAWMRQPLPTFQSWNGDREALAASLGLAASDLHADLPIERGSAGVPFVYIPIASEQALNSATPGPGLGAALRYPETIASAYLFVPPDFHNAQPVSARMFAPGMGIAEDAATGSAAGPFGAYLTQHDLAPFDDGLARITVAQGVRMGRPSRLVVTIERNEGEISRVRVGGEAVLVAQGDFFAPESVTPDETA